MTDTNDTPGTIEISKEEYEVFRKAREEKLNSYREVLTDYARRAVSNGASVARVNEALAELGLPALPTVSNYARYRARYRVTQFVELNTDHYRSETTNRQMVENSVLRYIQSNRDAGAIRYSAARSGYEEPDGGKLEFRSGDGSGSWLPADEFWATITPVTPVEVTPVDDLDQLKAIARKWVLILASEYGFCSGGVSDAFEELDLGAVPRTCTREVTFPVAGQAEVSVDYYEGEDETLIAERVAAKQRELLTDDSVHVSSPTLITEQDDGSVS